MSSNSIVGLVYPAALVTLLLVLVALLIYLAWDMRRLKRLEQVANQELAVLTYNSSVIDDEDLPIPPPNNSIPA